MTDYDTLLMLFGILRTACDAFWPTSMHPWAAIFLADFIRGDLPMADFMRLFSLVDSDYRALAQCIVEVK